MSSTKPFDVQMFGAKRYLFALDRWGDLIEKLPRSTWDDVAEVFYDAEESIFAAQGQPQKFKKLSPAYKAWKDTNFPGMPIMQMTGALKEALTGTGGTPGKATPIKRSMRNGIMIGVKSPYAHRHQYGTAGMPRRKIIQTTAAERVKFAKVLQRALVKIERQSFKGVPS